MIHYNMLSKIVPTSIWYTHTDKHKRTNLVGTEMYNFFFIICYSVFLSFKTVTVTDLECRASFMDR